MAPHPMVKAHADPCGDRECQQQVCQDAMARVEPAAAPASDSTGIQAEFLRAMPTQERRERLEAAFVAMRKDGQGLTLGQEDAIRAAMEVRRG